MDHDTGRKSPRFQELEIDRIREERHAPNKRDGMNHQPVLVDKALLGEELCKPCASGNADVLTGLLLELGDFFGGEPVASLGLVDEVEPELAPKARKRSQPARAKAPQFAGISRPGTASSPHG